MANIGRELGVVGLWGRARGACTLGCKKQGILLGPFWDLGPPWKSSKNVSPTMFTLRYCGDSVPKKPTFSPGLISFSPYCQLKCLPSPAGLQTWDCPLLTISRNHQQMLMLQTARLRSPLLPVKVKYNEVQRTTQNTNLHPPPTHPLDPPVLLENCSLLFDWYKSLSAYFSVFNIFQI